MKKYRLAQANKKTSWHWKMLLVFAVLFFLSLPNVWAVDTPTTKRLIDEGIQLLLKQDALNAIAKFDRVILLSPDHPEAHFRLGQAYIMRRQVSKGIEYLEKSTRIEPRNVRYSLYLAGIYERQGKFKKAMEEYQRIIDTGTRDPRIKEAEKNLSLATGQELAQKKELNAALLIFNGLLLEYPDDPQVLFSIGNAYMLLNRVEEAENTFLKLYEVDPKSEIVNMNLATIYEKTGRPQLAMKHLQNIIKQGKNNAATKSATVQYNIILGRELIKQRDWQGAMNAFQTVVTLDPTRTEAFFNISIANLQLGNTLMAERGFLSVLKVTPNDFSARLNLGQLYFDMGKVEEAKEQLNYVIENDESGRYAQQAKLRLNALHTLIADKALQSGKVEESLKEYQKALDYYSANTKASFNRGMIFIQQGKFGDARLEFESVVRHSPDNLRARLNLANVYEQLNMFSKAAEQYEIIMEKGADTREGQIASAKWKITKARGLWAEKRLTEAERIFEEIAKEQPNNFQAFAFLGIVQSSKGKLREAAKSYQRVLDLRPTNYAVKLLLGRVYEQLGLDTLAANEYRSILFAGGDIPQVPEAEDRLARVEARLSGFSNSLTYQYVYDSNLNLDDDNPFEEVRSDLALSFIYAMKTRDDLSFNINWSPTYSNFHLNQLDYLRSNLTSNARIGTPDKNWSLAFSRQDQDSLVNDEQVSQATSLTLGRGKKLFTPAFLYLTPEGFEGEKISTGMNANFGLRHIRSFSTTSTESITATFGLSFQQAIRWGVNINLGYTLTVYRNLAHKLQRQRGRVTVDDVTGLETTQQSNVVVYDSDDYEFNGHTGSLNLQKVLAPGLVGSLGIVGVLNAYTNNDSGAAARNEVSNRVNLMIGISPSLIYNFYKDLRFVARGSFNRNFSTLPVGISASAGRDGEDAIASFQSTSLGKYTRYTIEAGISMSF